jgi:hypothetical protein
VANFVDIYFLAGGTLNPLAAPQYNQLAYIDRPLVTEDGISSLSKEWQDYDNETSKWAQWGVEGFRQEFPGIIEGPSTTGAS